jgi:hypothetical protein
MSAQLLVSKACHQLLHAAELRGTYPPPNLVSAGRLLARARAGHGEQGVFYADRTGVGQRAMPAHAMNVTNHLGE